jgi:hypothetical protein
MESSLIDDAREVFKVGPLSLFIDASGKSSDIAYAAAQIARYLEVTIRLRKREEDLNANGL